MKDSLWKKDIVKWQLHDTTYLSVVFTWQLPQARKIIEESTGKIVVGGPAVKLMPDYLKGKRVRIEDETIFPALAFHNPLAVFTSRGCVNNCDFCAVPKIEGSFRPLDKWEPRPIVCDNNILVNRKHFDRVIDSLKPLPYVDFNQGLDATLFKSHHASRLSELKHVKVRFAFDSLGKEGKVLDAVETARASGLKDISCYVLIGFNDTPEEARYKLELLRKNGVVPFPMRYQRLDALEKDSYLAKGWTERELFAISRYYSKLTFLGWRMEYDEYERDHHSKKRPVGMGIRGFFNKGE